ncbi:hypothetical protein BCR44DRAFT_112183, partial [Catenaria anguillulae PL171]
HLFLPEVIAGLIPILGPLHLSLNLRSTLFKFHCPHLSKIYLAARGMKLPQSPSSYAIDLVIACVARAWCIVRED